MSAGIPPLIIAHRGASGYLPEHTLEAKALAFGLGADYLEQDIVATRDDQLVVLHDIYLDTVTDVSDVYPDRSRDDGRFYARDFDLAELKNLKVHERRKLATSTAVYPRRFPTDSGEFRIATLIEEIEMIKGLSVSTGRSVGIYPEIKAVSWHKESGIDLAPLVLDLLNNYGYRNHDDPVFLQCFDAREIIRIRRQLDCKLDLVQLIDTVPSSESDSDYEYLASADGLREIAEVANCVGPDYHYLYRFADVDGHPVSSGFVSAAHAVGLAVHPYTFRADAVGEGYESYSEMVRWFVDELSIDGLFTDFVDQTLAALA